MRAFLFPGQGSQKVGMGQALVAAYPEAKAVFDEADAVLGFSLSKLCFEGPSDQLTLTANAQPAILTTSVAALRVLQKETGGKLAPDLVAGHSLGEFSALVAAGTLALKDAVRLVHLRGKFMQEAVPAGTGAMAAIIGATAEEIDAACAEVVGELGAGEPVSAANLNGGGQVVISGSKAAVAKAMELLKSRGKRAVPLAVSAPFHCALMKPAAERLAAELAQVTFSAPSVPVVTNVEATPNQDPAQLRALLVKQVTAPVRWEESVQKMAALGVTSAIEVGTGTVLAGLVKRIAPAIEVRGAGDPDAIRSLAT